MKSDGWAGRFLVGLSVGLCALMGLAARGCDQQGSMPQISLGMADNGTTISVRKGTEVQVDLEDRGTTGFRWSIDAIDDRVLATAGEQSVAYPGIGAGAHRVFRFEAKGTGSSQLALKLWRSWEGDSSVIERFDVTVRVTDSEP